MRFEFPYNIERPKPSTLSKTEKAVLLAYLFIYSQTEDLEKKIDLKPLGNRLFEEIERINQLLEYKIKIPKMYVRDRWVRTNKDLCGYPGTILINNNFFDEVNKIVSILDVYRVPIDLEMLEPENPPQLEKKPKKSKKKSKNSRIKVVQLMLLSEF